MGLDFDALVFTLRLLQIKFKALGQSVDAVKLKIVQSFLRMHFFRCFVVFYISIGVAVIGK